jgi:hypothetical protein
MESEWNPIEVRAPEPRTVILWASKDNYRPSVLYVVRSRPGQINATDLTSMMAEGRDYRGGRWLQLSPPIPAGVLREG